MRIPRGDVALTIPIVSYAFLGLVVNRACCVLKIEKRNKEMVARESPPKQVVPYPPLSDALKNQLIFELHNVTGTFVGFFSPQYSNGISAPGWHLHFLAADEKHDGHVLEVVLQRATIQIDDMTALSVKLPNTAAFYAPNLTNNS
jgi:acetolactate decarboxylase